MVLTSQLFAGERVEHASAEEDGTNHEISDVEQGTSPGHRVTADASDRPGRGLNPPRVAAVAQRDIARRAYKFHIGGSGFVEGEEVFALCQQDLKDRAQSEADGDHDACFPEEITGGEMAVSIPAVGRLGVERTELTASHHIGVLHEGSPYDRFRLYFQREIRCGRI